LTGPRVYSEVYAPRRHPEEKGHWDLEFLFEAELGPREAFCNGMIPEAWNRLEFVDIDSGSKDEIARSLEDILARLD
jgi:hypothetical protein